MPWVVLAMAGIMGGLKHFGHIGFIDIDEEQVLDMTYVAEDGVSVYTAEDGSSPYVIE